MARRRNTPGHAASTFHLETLEDRILFSADTALAPLDILPEPEYELVTLQRSETAQTNSEGQVQASDVAIRELIIVDSEVSELDKLLDDLKLSSFENTHVKLLDAQSDALSQISKILAEQQGLTTVHLVSNGSSGMLELGGQQIEVLDLLSRAEELSAWRSALAPDADLQLYGLELTADGSGQQFVDTISRLTGATVGASDDLTELIVQGNGSTSESHSASQVFTALDSQKNLPVVSQQAELSRQAGNVNELSAFGELDLDIVDSVELVFIDESVKESEILFESLRDDDKGTQWLVVHIGAHEDGIDRVTQTLNGLNNVDAVHFLTHGDGQGIRLGSQTLDLNTSEQYAVAIASWARALDDEADLLIYGCDLASTEQGQELIRRLALACDCDVAASDDVTGHDTLGGDWLLEYTVGDVQTDIAFDDAAQAAWYGALDITTGLLLHNTFDTDASDSSGNSYDGTLTNGAVINTFGGTNQIGDGKVHLDGNDHYVDLSTHVANFDNLTQGTIALWVYTDSISTETVILQASDSGDNDSRLAVIRDGDEFALYVNEDTTTELNVVTTSANITTGTWNHVAVTVDSSGNKVFVNGVQQSVNYVVGSASTNRFFDDVSQLDFMAWGVNKFNGSSLNSDYDGFLDDGRVYDRALSSTDIAQLYNYTGVPNPQTFTVTNTLDDGSPGSLRWAIDQANSNLGNDTIEFNIAGSGSQVINLGSALPTIIESVTIDATTQTDWSEQSFLAIVIDGNNGVFDALTFSASADNSEIRGLIVRDMGQHAIVIQSGASGIAVAGNWLGKYDSDGSIVSGEDNAGVGVYVYGDNNIIGGSTDADRNVIHDGSYWAGVQLDGINATNNTVSGNYFGTRIDGNTQVEVAYAGYGVYLDNGANSNTIGGATTAHGNIFGGVWEGVRFDDAATSNNYLYNNRIGLGADGTTLMWVEVAGVRIEDAVGNVIGGVGVGNTFVSSVNHADHVHIDGADSTVIQGNYIGTDSTGTIAGGAWEGIDVDWSDNVTIGGTAAGEGNTIANNDNGGVVIEGLTTQGVSVRGNSIIGNDKLGIDLNDDDVAQLNDAGDVDSGPNALQNWVILTSAAIADDGTFSYELDTSTLASGTYTVDFYASTDRDGGQVEGERYIGTVNGVADGNTSLSGTLAGITLASGEYVTLITTDASGNSSEFSNYAVATDSDPNGAGPTHVLATATSEGGLSINQDSGNDTYLEMDSSSLLNGLTQFTIEAQLSIGASPSNPYILDYAYSFDSNDLSLFMSGNAVQVNLDGVNYAFTGNYS
nr:DUF4347 domain-containing protein [Granulosicoccus sp.]